MSSLAEKTFVIGVGAQKAGTTWLFEYFDSRDDCFMSPIKELHYFDAKHRPELCGKFQFRFVEKLLDRVRSETAAGYKSDLALKALVDRVSMIYDDSAYRRFFEDRVPEEVEFFGEITPSYAVLNREGFEDIRSQFANLRVIFLLRDSIERHYSLMRMKEDRAMIDSAHDSFISMLDRPGPAERGQYHETIRNLEEVFQPDEVHIAFYERLFCDEGLREICDFLGMPFVPGEYGRRVNPGGSGKKPAPLTSEQIEAGLEKFAEVYAFCRERFGDSLPDKWHA